MELAKTEGASALGKGKFFSAAPRRKWREPS
jgi:hypothetical protein